MLGCFWGILWKIVNPVDVKPEMVTEETLAPVIEESQKKINDSVSKEPEKKAETKTEPKVESSEEKK